MRSITAATCSLILGVPLVFAAPIHAQTQNGQNGALGTVQRFLGNGNNNSDQRAYEQGRRDEMQRNQADRNPRGYRQDYDQRYSSGNPSDYSTRPSDYNNRPSRGY